MKKQYQIINSSYLRMVGIMDHLKSIVFYFTFSLYFKIAYSMHYFCNMFFFIFKTILFITFGEREEGREEKREKGEVMRLAGLKWVVLQCNLERGEVN